jgi:hypothetical protein
LKELLWLVDGRCDRDNGGEGKVGDKVNLVWLKVVNLVVALHKEIVISINKYFWFFLESILFFNQKNGTHNCHLKILFIKLIIATKFSNRI